MWRLSTSLFRDDGEDQDDNFALESDGICALSTLQRMYAFLACLVGGVVCMFLSLVVFARPIKFAILFS
uniref:Vesicle transport protein n=1 Tax=Kalanchoe fedtschenkoi TaxID=63787 RepID=A0A7N0R8Z9_KALFE